MSRATAEHLHTFTAQAIGAGLRRHVCSGCGSVSLRRDATIGAITVKPLPIAGAIFGLAERLARLQGGRFGLAPVERRRPA